LLSIELKISAEKSTADKEKAEDKARADESKAREAEEKAKVRYCKNTLLRWLYDCYY